MGPQFLRAHLHLVDLLSLEVGYLSRTMFFIMSTHVLNKQID